MALRNTDEGWGLVARLLHWAIAFLIVFQIGVGLYMVEVVGDDLMQRFALTQWHKSWGVVVFALVALRIVWRAVGRRPPHPPMADWQAHASKMSHILLYMLMVTLPVSGWMMASASPFNDPDSYVQIRNIVSFEHLFGKETGGAVAQALGMQNGMLFELPDPFPKGDKEIEHFWKMVHFWSAMGMTVILAVHVAAALKHQFVDRDGLLRKMLVGR